MTECPALSRRAVGESNPRVGCWSRGASHGLEEWSSGLRLVGVLQNPAYRLIRHNCMKDKYLDFSVSEMRQNCDSSRTELSYWIRPLSRRNRRSRTLKIFCCFVSMFYFRKKLSDLRPMALARIGLEISGSFFPSLRRQVCWANSFLPRLYKLILRFPEDRRCSAGWKNVQERKLPPLETHSAVNSFHSRRIL